MANLGNSIINGKLRVINETNTGTLTVNGSSVSLLSGNIKDNTTSTAIVSAKQVADYISSQSVTPKFDGGTISGGGLTAGEGSASAVGTGITLGAATNSKPGSGYYITVTGSGKVSRAAITTSNVLYNGAVNGWVNIADNTKALDGKSSAATSASSNTATVYYPITVGSITNNTSGGTSTATINRGKQIKIGAGYYPSDLYYTAQGAPTLSGNATAAQVLSGKTFYSSSYTKQTGTMANNGATGGTITTQGGTYTIPAGYTSGGTVTANIGTGTYSASGTAGDGSNSGATVTIPFTPTATIGTTGYIAKGSKNGTVVNGTYTMPSGSASVSGGGLTKGTASGGTLSGGGLTKGTASGGTLSGGGLTKGTASGGTLSGGGLTIDSNYSGTPTVDIKLSGQTTSGVTITDTKPSSGYYLTIGAESSKLSGTTKVTRAKIDVSAFSQKVTRAKIDVSAFSQKVTRAKIDVSAFSQKVTRAAVTKTQTEGYISADSSTAMTSASETVTFDAQSSAATSETVTFDAQSSGALTETVTFDAQSSDATSASPTVTVNKGSKTEYVVIPTSAFTTQTASGTATYGSVTGLTLSTSDTASGITFTPKATDVSRRGKCTTAGWTAADTIPGDNSGTLTGSAQYVTAVEVPSSKTLGSMAIYGTLSNLTMGPTGIISTASRLQVSTLKTELLVTNTSNGSNSVIFTNGGLVRVIDGGNVKLGNEKESTSARTIQNVDIVGKSTYKTTVSTLTNTSSGIITTLANAGTIGTYSGAGTITTYTNTGTIRTKSSTSTIKTHSGSTTVTTNSGTVNVGTNTGTVQVTNPSTGTVKYTSNWTIAKDSSGNLTFTFSA